MKHFKNHCSRCGIESATLYESGSTFDGVKLGHCLSCVSEIPMGRLLKRLAAVIEEELNVLDRKRGDRADLAAKTLTHETR